MNEDFSNITFEDVELAIKILEKYITLSRRAESMLRKFRSYQSRTISPMGFSFEDFVNIAMAMKQRETAITEEKEEDLSFTQDEIERMKKIKEKLMKSNESKWVYATFAAGDVVSGLNWGMTLSAIALSTFSSAPPSSTYFLITSSNSSEPLLTTLLINSNTKER